MNLNQNVSKKLTRFGLTFLVFGTAASLLPGLDTAVLGAGSCTVTKLPVTITGGVGISVTGNGTDQITITNTNPGQQAQAIAVLGQATSNLVGDSLGDTTGKIFGGATFGSVSTKKLAHRKTAKLHNVKLTELKATQGDLSKASSFRADTSKIQ